MTAFAISPFFTVPSGRASLTVTTTVSPTRAQRRPEPPRTRITSARRAPELSAIFTTLSCCIIAASPRSLDYLDQAPTLGPREWPRLHDADEIALTGLVLLVMGMETTGPPDPLTIEGVSDLALDSHYDCLVHLVADHSAEADLAAVPSLISHDPSYRSASSSSRSRRIVFIRASSLRS